jgi:hypothetical protein
MLFPPRIIPALKGLRGKDWANLINQIDLTNKPDIDQMAFVLFMVRMNGCMTCSSDSYKAMRGCYRCASQSIQRFSGTDFDLCRLFQDALVEIKSFTEDDKGS